MRVNRRRGHTVADEVVPAGPMSGAEPRRGTDRISPCVAAAPTDPHNYRQWLSDGCLPGED